MSHVMMSHAGAALGVLEELIRPWYKYSRIYQCFLLLCVEDAKSCPDCCAGAAAAHVDAVMQ